MASSFPQSQSGSFTSPSSAVNLHFLNVRTSVDTPIFAVNGAAGGTTDTARKYVTGLDDVDVSADGVIQLDSDGTYAKGESSTLNIGSGLSVHVADFRVRKYWPLVNITGSSGGTADSARKYCWRLPDITFAGRGWVTSGWDGDLSTQTVSTFTLDIDDFGTIAAKSGGNATLTAKTFDTSFVRGGPVPISFNGRYSGGVDYTGTTFSWLFPTEPGDPVEGTLTLDLDATSNESNNALLYSFLASWTNAEGGAVNFSSRLRYSLA
jgi:hypothetical protein